MREIAMKRLWLMALATCCAAGCATTKGSAQEEAAARAFREQFPSRERLERIAAAPAPAKLVRTAAADVERWPLTGPLPDGIVAQPHHDDSAWQALLEQLAGEQNGAIALPESLHCVARETGLFYVAKDALPTERLAAFIAARCGAVSDTLSFRYFPGHTSGPEAALFTQIRPNLTTELRAMLHGSQRAAIWFGRQGDRAVAMIVTSRLQAKLEPLALQTGPTGTVNVQGELLAPAEHVEALINRGHFGFGRCAVDPTIALPRFLVSCDADVNDTSAWLEIASFQAGRIVGTVAARLIVWPQGAPGNSYDSAGYVNRALPVGPEPRAQLLGLINDVRHDAGLPPVALSERQSAVAAAVAPHYFAALAGTEPEQVVDEVVLGLRAGWEVDGNIRSGGFTYGLVAHTQDLGRLVDSMLERPSGREALLDRATRLVALGPVVDAKNPLVGLVASSYQLFDGANHGADAQRLLGRLTHARVTTAMAPLPASPELTREVEEAAARVQSGQSAPSPALHRALHHAAETHPGTQLLGWVFETSSLEALVFPQDLLQPRLQNVAIAVAHYRSPGAPWSRLVVFVLASQPIDQRTRADADHAPRL